MRQLIQDLLVLSRVTSRKQELAIVDLNEVVRSVLTDLEVAIEQAGAKIEVGDLPCLEADPGQMRQLLQNLLSNALKFRFSGKKPVVKIEGRVLPGLADALAARELCEIRVTDNGIGFAEKYAEQIFTVFQRLHARGEYEGTGIGLAVCRKITDRHGGSITARSAEGQGATFIVTLPTRQTLHESRSADPS
jgi:light-regulated signal transduction histidine kinase (bacteriophytochrome)